MKNWRRLLSTLTSLASLLLMVGAVSTAHAVPRHTLTNLPLPEEFFLDEKNKEMLSFIASFPVYQDTEDRDLYYYLPTFRPVSGMAATAIINDNQIKRQDQIDQLSEDLYSQRTLLIKILSAQYEGVMSNFKKLRPAELETFGPLYRNILKDLIKQRNEVILEQRKQETQLPQEYVDATYERMSDIFGLSGFSLSSQEIKDAGKRSEALGKLSRSNGGVFTANIYAGIDLIKVRPFMDKYHSERAKLNLDRIKIVKLPVEKYTWGGLAETVIADGGRTDIGVPAFRQINGGGSFDGATINIDLTLDGARKFAVNPPPMILPVYAKGELVQKYPAFVADLSCDFTTGWTLKGRSDVKDGLIIYNNDITNKMVAKDVATSGEPCTVKFIGGHGDAREDAYRKTLLFLQERLSGLFLKRAEMSREDKEAYFNGVMADVQANRHRGANQGWSQIFGVFNRFGLGGTLVYGLSRASNFYWHTHIEDIEMMSKLKWQERIVEDGNSRVIIDLPMRICVANNPNLNGYVACDEKETDIAVPMEDALSIALNSDECMRENLENNAVACGKVRKAEAPINPSTGNITMPESI